MERKLSATTPNFLTQFADTPLYNTKAVALETSVPADTFRAWERRYGIPNPKRTDGGHRLYSERDVALIRWLRDRTNEGLTISQAIALLESGNETGLSWLGSTLDSEPHTWERLIKRLYAAFADFDAPRAEQIMGEAFALYPLEDVFLKLVQPTMTEIGEQWHRGRISVTAEHFATQFIRRKLGSLLNTYSIIEGRGRIVVGCAPTEQHEIGILLLAIFLARHGWQVLYLGPDVPQSDLLDSVQRLKPDLVCLSASSTESAQALAEVSHKLHALSDLHPQFGYGGRAFQNHPTLCERVRGIYLGTTPTDAITTIAELMSQRAS